jgi:Arc/MetJ-type ribon-helix-helix transcriptional regulator
VASTSPHKFDAVSVVRMSRAQQDALDDWRRRQREIPTRPEAVREAIRRLVGQEGGSGTAEHAA